MLLPRTLSSIFLVVSVSFAIDVSVKKSRVWGPGLNADFLLPVRYFYVQLINKDGSNLTESVGEKAITVNIVPGSDRARIWTQVLDRHDGSYIVRYRPFSTSSDLSIHVLYNGRHIADSPYILKGDIYHETCNCPHQTAEQWAAAVGCTATYAQIENDLEPFKSVDMTKVAKEAVERFNQAGQHSICHYKIISNKVYRKCYGEHVGFKMFGDAILLSLSRKMFLPDIEFFLNLGDWPLETKRLDESPLPIFSWCGSKSSRDIVMPTYDLTEATLEMMGRVSLDMFSTQANTGPKWANKTAVAFWRGRDSRRERLDLVETALKHPDLVDARLTHMFFFPKDPAKYGELVPHISFFDFFKYKYQLNIDGTVAAYRFPYLLAGDAAIFKQDSEYYEHFYNDLIPNVHYIPLKHDLSDVLEKVKWAREHDDLVQKIAQNGQQYAREHLNPADVLCYHVRLFQKYATLLKRKPQIVKGFELVEQPTEGAACSCSKSKDSVKIPEKEL
ncbi:protein O-glucosyltransferase 2-like [Physella acuta]|uniref:protein O-glucosyltransferase 2-like n=1 Tax=Physella acuta TaxID=109671 RepID=UPI0027DB9F42|nr:protein O-glucosyltransferase 2-like [Physella acuta]